MHKWSQNILQLKYKEILTNPPIQWDLSIGHSQLTFKQTQLVGISKFNFMTTYRPPEGKKKIFANTHKVFTKIDFFVQQNFNDFLT